jgi:nucleoside triphosphate pyrophosphatase
MNQIYQKNKTSQTNQTYHITQEPMILASQSPRRKELLEEAGLIFNIMAADIDEAAVPLAPARNYVKNLSRIKADHIAKGKKDHWVIGADTVVVVEGTILGKPKTLEESIQMLTKLNNRQHSVFTGFTISCHTRGVSITKAIETFVTFKKLSEREIQWYAATDEPYDKAGGYGIQGIGAFLVRKISGSYSNVVGLPVCEVMEALTTLGAIQF